MHVEHEPEQSCTRQRTMERVVFACDMHNRLIVMRFSLVNITITQFHLDCQECAKTAEKWGFM